MKLFLLFIPIWFGCADWIDVTRMVVFYCTIFVIVPFADFALLVVCPFCGSAAFYVSAV